MSTRGDIAVSKFLEGYNCTQSIVYAFADIFGIEKNLALKIACGFGAGMGRKGEVCGAVSGGIMVIGLKYGRGEKDDRKVTDATYQKVRELLDSFADKQGTFICRKLLDGCELTTEEGQKQFKDRDYLHKICKPCVCNVADILDDIL
jgi:C_GCAxxG_C_C family probable redox protein